MPLFQQTLRLAFAALILSTATHAQDTMSTDGPLMNPATQSAPAPITRSTPDTPPPPALPAPPPYDKAIFRRTLPPAQLAFITQYANAPAADLFNDRQFHKLIHSVLPGVMFHYGRDVSLPDTVDMEFDNSRIPIVIRNNRYVSLYGEDSSHSWMRHDGRCLIWIDLQEGTILGAFFFRPNNGEPSPTLTVFTRQIKEEGVALSELPPAFSEDLNRWSDAAGIPPVTYRYFIGDMDHKFLLEHDEDLCYYTDSNNPAPDNCQQLNADAADHDMISASYLEQVHYATNATAWMITDPDQTAWFHMRDNTCARLADPLACHIRMTRERVGTIIHRPPVIRPRP